MAAASNGGSSSSTGGGLWASLTSLANALTNFFPIFVLGAAALGLAQPAAYDFFSPAAITPSLAITMLGMGLTLTFEVGTLIVVPQRFGASGLAHGCVAGTLRWRMCRDRCAALLSAATLLCCRARARQQAMHSGRPPSFPQDFKRVLTTPGRIFAGFALQYTIMPAAAYAVSRLAGLPLAFTIG